MVYWLSVSLRTFTTPSMLHGSSLNLRNFSSLYLSSSFPKYTNFTLNLINISKLRILLLQVCKWIPVNQRNRLPQTQSTASPIMLGGSFLREKKRLHQTYSCVLTVKICFPKFNIMYTWVRWFSSFIYSFNACVVWALSFPKSQN